MIELDFELYLASEERDKKDRQEFSDIAIRTNLLEGELTFLVSGVDLAWKGVVPILDVARQLFWAVGRLSVQRSKQIVEILDYYEVIRLELVGNSVALSSGYTHGLAQCELNELRERTYQFAMKALHTCIERFPEAATSRDLRDNYPLRLGDR